MNSMHAEISNFIVSRMNHSYIPKFKFFSRMWSELGLFMTMAEEKEIPDTGFRHLFFFVDHDP